MVEQSGYIELAEKVDVGSIINKKTFAAAHIYRNAAQSRRRLHQKLHRS